MKKKLFAIAALLAGLCMPAAAQVNESYVAGERIAQQYAYGYGAVPGAHVVQGNSATGTQTVTVCPAIRALADGRQVQIFSGLPPTPVSFDTGLSTAETVTPTSVSLLAPGAVQGVEADVPCASITGTFNQLHGASQNVYQVRSGTFGLQEAINDAGRAGGSVTIGNDWGGTNTMITAAAVFPGVAIVDKRNGVARYWNPTPTGAALAVPVTLTAQAACDATHQFCSDATVAGSASYAGGALFGCVAYVDIMGNEGPCSLTANFTDVSAKAIDVAAPVASPGAVGYVVYLSLDAGTYAQAYQIPSTALNCTLTTLETILPACAVANATYGQSASTFGANSLFTTGGSQITTISLNTGLHFTKIASVAMTAASLTPVTNSSVTYSYAPGNRVGSCDFSSANVVNYAASGSSATTIPNAIATWTVPASCFNFIGAEFRVSGKFTFTDGGDSSTEVRVAWDSAGTNTTTVPTKLCSIIDTATGTGAAYNGTYYCSVKVATTGATGTALVDGYANLKLAAGASTLVRDSTDVAVAPSASINLTAPARIVVYFIGTGATNNPGAQGLSAKLEILN